MPKYRDLSVDITNEKLIPDGGFNEVGPDGMVSTEIKDEAIVSEVMLNKMATSIPTPFARLFLYNTAFRDLNSLERVQELQGQAYLSEVGNSSLSHHLVAECLDMLEFIFEYGDDPLFTIHEWDRDKDTSILGATGTNSQVISDTAIGQQKKVNPILEKHKKLGKALQEVAMETLPRDVNKIYIFKYDGDIVGGTSPFTLVYTSPNWRRKMKEKGHVFYGHLGNQLFAPINQATPVYALCQRSANFRFYLYSLQQKFNLPFNGFNFEHFNRYLENTKDHYETAGGIHEGLYKFNELRDKGLEEHFKDFFKPLKPTDTEKSSDKRRLSAETVTASGVEFYTTAPEPDTQSDYTIVPTVEPADLPVEKGPDGKLIDMAQKLPLVLGSQVLGGKSRYWFHTPYNPTTLPAVQEDEYFDRVLPGVPGNRRYAYLTENDIFEDNIMYLGYKINKKRFFTGFDGDSPFLLPIKPTLLKYFKVEDLEKMVTVTPGAAPVFPKVTVTVRIPIKGGEVVFSRIYEKNKGKDISQYVDFSKTDSFKLGIFPFYTYAGTEAAEEDIYKVLLARMSDLSLEFYNRDFVTPMGEDVVKSRIRTKSHDHNNITEYFTLGTHMRRNNPGIPGTFTTIRVLKNGVGGLIVPKFQKAHVSKDQYVFCVDFGTANTNVAYAKTKVTAGSPLAKVTHLEIDTLKFNKAFDQMAMLNEEGAEGGGSDLNKYILSEYMPAQIGEGDIKFPIRTIACKRSDDVQGEPQLFGDYNIAFYTDKYGNSTDYDYETELKWSNANRKLMGTFFRELMWMCKNKVAELGGAVDFHFYFTYPQSMSNPQKIQECWAEAALAVRSRAQVVNNNTLTATGRELRVYEGTAPWYRAISLPAEVSEKVYANEDFLNIDIGGGSTDVIYITKPMEGGDGRLMSGFSFSAKFAAGDLWGDGVAGNDLFSNGFLTAFESKNLPKKGNRKEYDEYKSHATGSADLIGYLFSHEEFELEDLLISDSFLRVPMLVHFAATMYYVARTLAMQQLALPRHISFSGMGSLYIKYMTNTSTGNTVILSKIIRAIFNFAGLKVVDKEGKEKPLSIRFSDDPKGITAEGGVLMYNTTLPGLSDKVVESTELNFYLYDGEEDEEEAVVIKYQNVKDYKEAVKNEVKKFLELFKDDKFIQAVNMIDGAYPQFDWNSASDETLETGFDNTLGKESGEIPQAPVKDVPFFWPLKQLIYVLSREQAAKTINSNNNTAANN